MRLYYSTTAKTNTPQQKASQSLGGVKSSSPVPNSAFGNLFSDLSLLTIEKNLPEYIGLVLINERGNKVENIKIWVNSSSNNFCKYKISIVELNARNEFELLPSINSKPLYAEFHEVNSEEDSWQIEEMLDKEQYGLWIERSINTESEIYQKFKNCDFLFANPNALNSQVEEVEIKISFSDATNEDS